MNKQQEPRLRFRGFTEDWEEKTLADVSIVERGKFSARPRNDPKFFGGSMPFIQTGDITNSDLFLTNYTQTLNSNGILVSKVFPQKTILITIAANIGDTAITTFDIACPDSVVAIQADENRSNVFFLKYILDLKHAFLNDCATQNAQKNINLQVLNPLEIKLCSLAEQTHLGNFFRRLDSQIAESRAALDKIRQLKKAMLAKMFPANGEKIPKIRFKGFEGEWECRKLGEMADIVRGASPRPIQDSKWFDDNSDIGWLRISDVTIQNGRIHYLEQKISKAGQEKTRVLEEPHLLLSIAASVGKPVINYVKTGVHDGFLVFKNPNFELEFMFQYLDSFVDTWQCYGQPGTQVNLNSDIVKNAEFFIPPNPKEQTAIGNFFCQLDKTIALQSAEVEKLNQLKKGLLAAMLM